MSKGKPKRNKTVPNKIELLIQRTKYTWDIEKNMRKIILGNTKTWQIKNERQI